MSSGSINVVLNLDSSGFNSSLTAAQRGLQNLNLNINNTVRNTGGASSAFSSLGSSLHGIIINAALAGDALRNIHAVTTGVMLGIAKTNGELERMQMLMTGMSKATTQAAREAEGSMNMDFVLNMAKNAPVALAGLTDAFVKLKTTGIDPTKGSLQALVDANAHFGGTEDSLKRASIAISQMSSKGKVSMEELRQQLAEAIPNASQLMARGLGISMEELIKKVSSGTVNSKKALELMFKEMEVEFAGSAERMMKSWVGLTSQLSTQWMLFQKDIGDASYFDEAKKALSSLVDVLKTEDMAAFAASFGHTLAEVTKGIVDFTKYVLANRGEIVEWVKNIGEVYLALKAWSILSSIVLGVISFSGAIMETVAAMRAAATVAAAFEILIAPLVIGVGALALPLTIVAGLLVAGGLAWMEWGNQAEDSLAGVKQAVKDGVKVSEDGLKAIAKAQQDAAGATHQEKTLNAGGWGAALEWTRQAVGIGVNSTSIDDRKAKGAEADLLVEKEAQRKSYQEIQDFREDLRKKADDVKKSANLQEGADLAALAKLREDAGVKDLEKDLEYTSKHKALREVSNKAVLDGLKQLEIESKPSLDKFNKTLNDSLTLVDPKKKKDLSNDMNGLINGAINDAKKSQASLADLSDAYSPDTKGKDKAAKAAAKEIERQNNIEDNMRAQLAKKTSILSQSRERGADIVGPGPNEAKILSLIETGHKFTEGTLEMATALDKVDKKLVDQGKSFDALDGQLRNSVKNVAKSAVDLQHSKANAANGGYETMSKETLRMNEQMAITEETISRLSEGVDQNNAAWIKETAAVRANTAEYVKNQTARDAIDRDNKAMIAARVTNASLNETVRGRLDEEYALKVESYKRENELVGLTTDEIKAKHEGMYAELTAMENVHARSIENPLITMARSWGDMSENIKQASTGWMSSFSDEMTKMVTTGKADFRSLTVSILADLAKIAMQKALVGIGTSIIGMFEGSALSGAAGIGGGTGMSGFSGVQSGMGGFSGGAAAISPKFNFANGGIMTSMGKLPLNAYASGGIAKTPQVAIFGEGRKNEAFVPLPDGKSIPVTMKGKGDSGTNVSININVADNGTGTKNQQGGNPNNDMWGKMADNIKGIVVQTITEQKRPGGQLYSR